MARVIKAFRDRLSGQIFLVGDNYESNPNRIAELTDKGYLQKAITPKRRKTAKVNEAKKKTTRKNVNDKE